VSAALTRNGDGFVTDSIESSRTRFVTDQRTAPVSAVAAGGSVTNGTVIGTAARAVPGGCAAAQRVA
jgi:hypothetical protein